MIRYIWLAFFVSFVPWSSGEGNEAETVYREILPELVYRESYFSIKDIPPPPPPKRKEGESKEVYELKVRVNELEEKLNFILKESNKPKEIHLLKTLLPLAPDSFTAAGIFVGRDYYDSTWTGQPLPNNIRTSEPSMFTASDLKAGVYDIQLIDAVPEPYALEEKEHIKLFYLQLSEIIFNKSKNKGVFYYAVSTDGNTNGTGGYAYIAKVDSKWTIQKLE